MSSYSKPCCRICGDVVTIGAPSVLEVKQKKPGSIIYMHDSCLAKEQRELKKEAAEK